MKLPQACDFYGWKKIFDDRGWILKVDTEISPYRYYIEKKEDPEERLHKDVFKDNAVPFEEERLNRKHYEALLYLYNKIKEKIPVKIVSRFELIDID